MDIHSYLWPRHATPSQRSRLSDQPRPLLDPWVQDYAAWRLRSLRWACLAVALSYGFAIYGGDSVASVKLGLRRPSALEGWLELGLGWYLRSLAAGFCLLLAASVWYWARPSWSSFLIRLSWALTFFGPMPLFLIPFSTVLGQHGLDALLLSSAVIRGLLAIYVPALFALLPALIRASLVLKRFLPESALPGVLVVVGASLQALIYFLLICILIQAVPDLELILGFLSLALAPLVWLFRAKTLVRPACEETGRRALRVEGLASLAFTLVGSAVVLREVSRAIDLHELIGQVVDIRWALSFLTGVLASRAILSVILVDGLLATLHHAHQAEKVGTADAIGESLGRKIGALGEALGEAASTITDG